MEISQDQKIRSIWRKCFLQFIALDNDVLYYYKNLPPNVSVDRSPYWPIIKDISSQYLDDPSGKQSDANIDSETKDDDKKDQSTTTTTTAIININKSRSDQNYIHYRTSLFLQEILCYPLLYPEVLYTIKEHYSSTEEKTIGKDKSNIRNLLADKIERISNGKRPQIEIINILLKVIFKLGSFSSPQSQSLLPSSSISSFENENNYTYDDMEQQVVDGQNSELDVVDNLLTYDTPNENQQKVKEDNMLDLVNLREIYDELVPIVNYFTNNNSSYSVNMDIGILDTILDNWNLFFNSYILKSSFEPLSVIDHLVRELSNLETRFSNSKPMISQDDYLFYSDQLDSIKKYLNKAFSLNGIQKKRLYYLYDLLNNPSYTRTLSIFRSLDESPSSHNRFSEGRLAFLRLIYWTLTEKNELKDIYLECINDNNKKQSKDKTPPITYSNKKLSARALFPDSDGKSNNYLDYRIDIRRYKKSVDNLAKSLQTPGQLEIILKQTGRFSI